MRGGRGKCWEEIEKGLERDRGREGKEMGMEGNKREVKGVVWKGKGRKGEKITDSFQ